MFILSKKAHRMWRFSLYHMKNRNKKSEVIMYSAPPSLMLNGEYGILYGKPIVGIALDLRITCVVSPSDQTAYDKRTQTIIAIIMRYLRHSKSEYTERPFQYSFHSTIPKSGSEVFHSSSAEVVALVSAVLYFFTQKEHTADVINTIAYEVEKKVRLRPLGFANTASCMGGMIYYRKEFEFLKGIYQLFVKIPRAIEDTLFIINTGENVKNNQDMISDVGALYQKNPRRTESLLNEMEKCTKRMVISFVKEDLSFFQDTVVKSQMLLERLGVVSDKSRKNIKHFSSYAVSKVLGYEGVKKSSGFLLCSARDVKGFTQFLKKSSYVFYPLRQSLQGVRREFT